MSNENLRLGCTQYCCTCQSDEERGTASMDVSKFPAAFCEDVDIEAQNRIREIEQRYDAEIAELKKKLSAAEGEAAQAPAGAQNVPGQGASPVSGSNEAVPGGAPTTPSGPGGTPAGMPNRPMSAPGRVPGGSLANRPGGAPAGMPGRPGMGGMPPGRGTDNKPDLFDKAADKLKEKADEKKKSNPVQYYVVATGFVLGALAALARANSLMDTHDVKLIAISSFLIFAVVAIIPIIGLGVFTVVKKLTIGRKDAKIEDEISELEYRKRCEVETVREMAEQRKAEYAYQFEEMVQARGNALATVQIVKDIVAELFAYEANAINEADRSAGIRTISVASTFNVFSDKITYGDESYVFLDRRIENLAANFDQAAMAWAIEALLRFLVVGHYKSDPCGSIPTVSMRRDYRKVGENADWAAVVAVDYSAENTGFVELMSWG